MLINFLERTSLTVKTAELNDQLHRIFLELEKKKDEIFNLQKSQVRLQRIEAQNKVLKKAVETLQNGLNKVRAELVLETKRVEK
jgi:hypothetical protein